MRSHTSQPERKSEQQGRPSTVRKKIKIKEKIHLKPMKQNCVQDFSWFSLVSNLGGGHAYNSESSFGFCHPDFTWQAASPSPFSERMVGGGREKQSKSTQAVFLRAALVKGLGKAEKRLSQNATQGVSLHGFQMSTFSLSSISKENPMLAILLYKIAHDIQGISAELSYQQNGNCYFQKNFHQPFEILQHSLRPRSFHLIQSDGCKNRVFLGNTDSQIVQLGSKGRIYYSKSKGNEKRPTQTVITLFLRWGIEFQVFLLPSHGLLTQHLKALSLGHTQLGSLLM